MVSGGRRGMNGRNSMKKLVSMAVMLAGTLASSFSSCAIVPDESEYPFPESWVIGGSYDATITLLPDGSGEVENVRFGESVDGECRETEPVSGEVRWEPKHSERIVVWHEDYSFHMIPETRFGDTSWNRAVFINPCSLVTTEEGWTKFYVRGGGD